jgi:8-oxo-dGTP diphosphatase
MQRDQSKYAYVSYKYEFPGGKIEPGEARTTALERELKEEMNIDISVTDGSYFMTVHHTYPDFEITMHCFKCPVTDRTFVMNDHINFRWLLPERLSDLDWAEADLPIVKALMKG